MRRFRRGCQAEATSKPWSPTAAKSIAPLEVTPSGGSHEPLRVRACLTLLFAPRRSSTVARHILRPGENPLHPTTPAPAAKAEFATPLKGEGDGPGDPGHFEFRPEAEGNRHHLQDQEHVLGADRDAQDGRVLVREGKMVSTDTQRYRQPFQPGEVIEMTTHAPATGTRGLEQER